MPDWWLMRLQEKKAHGGVGKMMGFTGVYYIIIIPLRLWKISPSFGLLPHLWLFPLMTSSNQDKSQFKILMAGGSLVGLGLALAFERARIDYELFEKKDSAPQLGVSIRIHPHSIRILEQLGVWEDIKKQVVPLRDRNHNDGNGHCLGEPHVLVDINEM